MTEEGGSKRTALVAIAAAFSVVAAVAAVFALWPANGRALAVVVQRTGVIASGEKFGVKVGMGWRDADRVLRGQFEPTYVLWERPAPERTPRFPSVISERPVLRGAAEVTYRDAGGSIILDLRDGRVRKIRWRYPVRLAIAR